MRALDIAATGMAAQNTRVEVISNNISNMSTTGYKPRRAEFVDLLYTNVREPGAISSVTGTELPTGLQLGMGVRVAAVNMRVAQGALKEGSNDLDLAIEGRGWFEVRLPDGESAYTRDGSFDRNSEGLIVNAEGYQLGDGITIPANARRVEINASGEVYAYFDGQVNPTLIGNVTLATFVNEKGLEAIGGNLFKETAASGPATLGTPDDDGVGRVRQRYLETSAVDVVEEITELIQAQRGYEMNSKVVTAADQMLGATVQLR